MKGKKFEWLCTKCDDRTKAEFFCAKCGTGLCAKHAYTYVDGNNGAITRNSRPHCERCYREVYR
jgi:hypothetical protein